MSDDVIGGSTKLVQHSIKHISRNIRAVVFNLAPEINIIKETKRDPLCGCHDNSYATGHVLIKTKFLRFHLKQQSSTPNNLMGRFKTI